MQDSCNSCLITVLLVWFQQLWNTTKILTMKYLLNTLLKDAIFLYGLRVQGCYSKHKRLWTNYNSYLELTIIWNFLLRFKALIFNLRYVTLVVGISGVVSWSANTKRELGKVTWGKLSWLITSNTERNTLTRQKQISTTDNKNLVFQALFDFCIQAWFHAGIISKQKSGVHIITP